MLHASEIIEIRMNGNHHDDRERNRKAPQQKEHVLDKFLRFSARDPLVNGGIGVCTDSACIHQVDVRKLITYRGQ